MGIQGKQTNKKKYTANGTTEEKLGKSVGHLLGGGFLTRAGFIRWLPFIVFLGFLAIIYIANIFVAESNKRAIEKLTYELKEYRYEYLNTKSKLMYLSKQSQVANKLKSKGLKESTVPPKKLIIQKPE